jgi:hypothetical protein
MVTAPLTLCCAPLEREIVLGGEVYIHVAPLEPDHFHLRCLIFT